MAQSAHVQAVPIPEGFRALLLANLNVDELSAWVTEAAVVEAVRQHVISRNKGAALLGLEDYEERETFFERHELFNETTLEMLEMDRSAIESLRTKRYTRLEDSMLESAVDLFRPFASHRLALPWG